MATYAEILAISLEDGIRQKVYVACIIAADKIRAEPEGTTNHAQRLAWAKSVYMNTEATGNAMTKSVLAQNAGITATAIRAASDAAVQTAVDASVNLFALG